MAIFPARRIGCLPPERARPTLGITAALASVGADRGGYGMLTIGPVLAQPLPQVEVEEAASRWTTSTQRNPDRAALSLANGGPIRPPITGFARGRGFQLAYALRRSA